MDFRIASIAEQHVEGFREALDSVARERKYLAFLEAPPPDQVRAFVMANIAARSAQFVAIVEESVVGWCDVLPKPRPAFSHSGALGMGIIKTCRGRGIGKALIQTTLDAAKANGLTRVELTVRVDNERARKLYESVGFVVEGLCKRHTRVDGKYADSYMMALLFEEV